MGDMPTTSLDSEDLPVVSVYSYIYIGLFLTHVFVPQSPFAMVTQSWINQQKPIKMPSLWFVTTRAKKGKKKTGGGGGISLYTVFSCSMNYYFHIHDLFHKYNISHQSYRIIQFLLLKKWLLNFRNSHLCPLGLWVVNKQCSTVR